MPERTGETPQTAAARQAAQSPGVMLGERYRIHYESPLAEFDAPGTVAFEATDLQTPTSKVFARICLPGTLPRRELLPVLRQNRDVHMMRPVEWAPIAWPPLDRTCLAVVFERPERGPLVASGEQRFTPLSVADLTQKVLAPTALALAQLSRRGIAYRAIRPDNLYGSAKGRHIMLGECVTSPPGFGQPAAYESIESAMTPPLARGVGTLANDLYALGATVMTLALGRVPFQGLDADEIIAQKLARGSFTALLGGERVPFGLREVLRGLLADNLKARWGLAELQQWLGGGANKSAQDQADTRLDRPFMFAGRECWGFRDIAHAFGKDWRKAATCVLDDSFLKWAKRGLGDADLAAELTDTIRDARQVAGPNASADARLVARIATVLDPLGPLRYKGVVAAPDGLGPLLADAVRVGNRELAQRICELLSKGLPIERIVWQEGGENPDVAIKVRPYRQVQQLLRHNGPGYGLERCLYELNPHLPCQSKAVERAHVETAGELLPALEAAVKESGSLPSVFDRHLAAFVASRVKRNFDRDLAAMENLGADSALGKLGMLRIFSWLQQEHGPANLPHLSAWLAEELKPATERFASRSLRALALSRLAAVAESGDLTAILNALSDRALVERDAAGRRLAVAQYREARREILRLESGRGIETAQRAGQRAAASTAWLCALGSALVTTLMAL